MRPLFESCLGLQYGANSLGLHTGSSLGMLSFLLGRPPSPPILLQTVPLPVNEKRELVATSILSGLNILSLQGSFLALAAFWIVDNKYLIFLDLGAEPDCLARLFQVTEVLRHSWYKIAIFRIVRGRERWVCARWPQQAVGCGLPLAGGGETKTY